MKCIKLLAGATFLALTTFAHAANTVSLSTLVFEDTLVFKNNDGLLDAHFDHQFDKSATGKTFLDIYNFKITSADVGAAFSSAASFGKFGSSDLSFSSFNLYAKGSSTPLVIGKISTNGKADAGSFENMLAAGSYSLQISGTVLGSKGGSYNGLMSVSPVPEPETWSMSLSGLVAVGFLAMRRRAKSARA
jgi:hypothetical protein